MKQRIKIRRIDGVRQRYWIGRRPQKNYGMGIPIRIKGRKSNETLLVDSDKLKRDKELLDKNKVIVMSDSRDTRSDLVKLQEIQEMKRAIRNQSRKDIKFAPIEDIRNELETEGRVMLEAENKLGIAKTQEERRLANDEWLKKDERFRAIKEKLYPDFHKFNLTDEQEGL